MKHTLLKWLILTSSGLCGRLSGGKRLKNGQNSKGRNNANVSKQGFAVNFSDTCILRNSAHLSCPLSTWYSPSQLIATLAVSGILTNSKAWLGAFSPSYFTPKNAPLSTTKKEARESGWNFGRSMLTIPYTRAIAVLQRAGCTVYSDKLFLYGPAAESKRALCVLAINGCQTSLYALYTVFHLSPDDILAEASR